MMEETELYTTFISEDGKSTNYSNRDLGNHPRPWKLEFRGRRNYSLYAEPVK